MMINKQTVNDPWNVSLVARLDIDDLIFGQDTELTESQR